MFNLFDRVQLTGRDNFDEIPRGKRGTIVECFHDMDGYLVEFRNSDDDYTIAEVQGSELRLVKRYAPKESHAEVLV